ncbi:MAG: sterol desaturase family protein, partial [Bacteroidetes bacterium]|nr:sterol desaturase family protein [Bacteroidota bacterium]
MVPSFVLSAIAFAVLFTPLRHYTLVYAHLNDYPIWWVPLSVLLSLVVHDTYFYWMHRALHHKSLFRFTHLVHHESVNPSPWAAYSFHALEAVTEGLVVLVITLVMPVHPLSVILFTLA